MWRIIDKEMDLKFCDIYCYIPEEDPYDGDEGALWSYNYFFFNKMLKRVCYVHLRGLSIISHSPPDATPLKMPREDLQLAASHRSLSRTSARKRASYWLGDRAVDLSSDDEVESDEEGEGENDGSTRLTLDSQGGDTRKDPINLSDSEETDEVRDTLSPDEPRFPRDAGKSYNLRSRSKSAGPVGVSEHAAATMDL